MAGSFGFESSKYDTSIAIGERRLLPAVRKAEASTVIIADGFSCREQIAQQTGRHALHLAEVIQLAETDFHADDVNPEAALVRRRKASRRKARWRALGVLSAAAAGGVLLAKCLKQIKQT
jgi:hypothetical protein